jgi:hypothetical protein
MIPAGNRAMLVNSAEVGVVVEEDAAILNRTESHDGFLVVELYPKRIIRRHRDFVMGVKADEFQRGFACSINDPFDVAVGDAQVSRQMPQRCSKFQILLPVLRATAVLDSEKYGNQKSVWCATCEFFINGSMDGSPIRNKAPEDDAGFIVRRCAADIATPTRMSSPPGQWRESTARLLSFGSRFSLCRSCFTRRLVTRASGRGTNRNGVLGVAHGFLAEFFYEHEILKILLINSGKMFGDHKSTMTFVPYPQL